MKTVSSRTIVVVTFLSALLALAGCGRDENPPAKVQFQQFKLSSSAGPCQPGADCSGYIMLASNGTLTYDKFDELPEGTLHTTTVTQAELDAAIPVLTDSSLVALLATSGQICPQAYDLYEGMTLWTLDGTTYAHETTGCSDQSIENARKALRDLAGSYFP